MTKEIQQEMELLVEGVDESKISDLLKNYVQLTKIEKTINDVKEKRKNQIKIYLRERGWNRFMDDDTQISVTLTKLKKESFDKEQLKLMLTEAQLVQVTKIQTYDKISILTPERRKELTKLVQKKKL